MKYLKSYENKIIDRILDKISKYGMDKLSDLDKKYLQNIEDEDLRKEIEDRDSRVKGFWSYDPREDGEFFDELGDGLGVDIDFSKYDDDMIEEGRYEIMYDELPEEDLKHFEEFFDLKDLKIEDGEHKGYYKPYGKLSSESKEKFKEYINEIY